jgi:hypothetical protein
VEFNSYVYSSGLQNLMTGHNQKSVFSSKEASDKKCQHPDEGNRVLAHSFTSVTRLLGT